MGATTPRGYPYPFDTDAINVALDIQMLAESIDTDIVDVINAGGAYDAIQDARLVANAAQDKIDRDALNARIDANTAQDNTDRTRMEAINTAAVNNHNAQQTSINSISSTTDVIAARVNSTYTGMRTYANNVGITTDGNGYASVFYPIDPFGGPMFPGGSSPVVQLSCPNRGGAPQYWLTGCIQGSQSNGFGSHWTAHATFNIHRNVSVIISYTATGPHV